MRRTAATVATGALVTTALAAAGAGATVEAGATVLTRPFPAGTDGRVTALAHDVARLAAPPGTPFLAVVSGAVEAGAGGAGTALRLVGSGDDSGLTVEVTGLSDGAAPDARVRRGDHLGVLPAAARSSDHAGATTPSSVLVTATLDGVPVDVAALLDASLHGGSAALEGGFVRPVDGAVVTQGFGCTAFALEPVDRLCPSGHFHSGIDLAVSAGTPVMATLPGTVHVVLDVTGYGLHVVVDHGGGLQSLYAHLSAVTVPDGSAVDAGEVLGLVGSTGNSTGPHLHFEIRRDGIAEDPATDMALP